MITGRLPAGVEEPTEILKLTVQVGLGVQRLGFNEPVMPPELGPLTLVDKPISGTVPETRATVMVAVPEPPGGIVTLPLFDKLKSPLELDKLSQKCI